jgi:hypothetical protein
MPDKRPEFLNGYPVIYKPGPPPEPNPLKGVEFGIPQILDTQWLICSPEEFKAYRGDLVALAQHKRDGYRRN